MNKIRLFKSLNALTFIMSIILIYSHIITAANWWERSYGQELNLSQPEMVYEKPKYVLIWKIYLKT